MRDSKTVKLKGSGQGHRQPQALVDVTITCHGSLFLFHVHTVPAEQWIEENVSGEQSWLGSALAVEHRYAEELAAGMVAEGLKVK